MRSLRILKASVILICFVFSGQAAVASEVDGRSKKLKDLFDSEELLELRMEGDINALMKDRGEDPSYHTMRLYYNDGNSFNGSLDLRVRVRGNFRRLRENCEKPPLKFNFKKHQAPDSSPFAGQSELKLVVPCAGEKHLIREYLTYKLYNLFTEHSFRVRLVSLIYHDSKSNNVSKPEYGFLIEDHDQMAARNRAIQYKRDYLRPENIDPDAFLRMSVFAYMIGNTDWSIQYRHNIKLIFLDDEKILVAVPYDFDLVGLVSSPYARPAPELRLKSVRERVFRGYCIEDLDTLEPTLEQFRTLKPDIYKVLAGNKLLEEDYKKFAVNYLDDFYETLDNPQKRSRAFSYPCNRYGTGNIVIRGMDN